MESLNDNLFFWTLYLLSGFVGFWCWGKMVFWVKTRGLFYHLYSAVGAVLIFTPAPVAGDLPMQLAPGVIVLVFNVISHGVAGFDGYISLFSASFSLALFTVMIAVLAGLAPSKAVSSQSEKRKEPVMADSLR